MRLPPNLSKIFFQWGLREALVEKGLVSHTILFTKCTSVDNFVVPTSLLMMCLGCADESGDYLGQQVWNQDVLKETQGVFLLTTVRLAESTNIVDDG